MPTINLRLSDADLTMIDRGAAAAGVTRSRWIRMCCEHAESGPLAHPSDAALARRALKPARTPPGRFEAPGITLIAEGSLGAIAAAQAAAKARVVPGSAQDVIGKLPSMAERPAWQAVPKPGKREPNPRSRFGRR